MGTGMMSAAAVSRDGVPAPVAIIVLVILGTAACAFHWIYAARARPAVREFIDGVKPLLRFPYDEAFLFAAVMFDIATVVALWLLVRDTLP